MPERSVKVRLTGDVSDFNRALLGAAATAKAFTKELDTGTDRATNLTQSILAIAPAAVPIAATAIPAITGLSNQLAFAAAGAGVAAIAFQGVGDALKATNDYALKPTQANLDKMHESLQALGPAGQNFVSFLQGLRPQLEHLQGLSQGGLFPGVEDGISELMTLLPQAERLVVHVATALGDLTREAGFNLASTDWEPFFTFLEQEARPTLLDMGRTLGNFAKGFANLWMAFDPLSDQFSKSFLQMARDFAEWTDGLDKTQGFQEFVDYIQDNGPKAFHALEAIGNALLQIIEAAAPVGSAVLPVITALADAIATVADSDLGPAIIGIVALTSALSRLKALAVAANTSAIGGVFGKSAYSGLTANIKSVTAATNELRAAQVKLGNNPGMQNVTTYRENLKGVRDAELGVAAATKARGRALRTSAAGAAGLALVMSGLDNKLHLTNTTSLALAGSLAGPWGAAVGAGIGLAIDFSHQTDGISEAMNRAKEAVDSNTASLKEQEAAIDAARAKTQVRGEPVPGGRGAVTNTTGATAQQSKELSELESKYRANVRAAQDAKFAEAGLSQEMKDASVSTRRQVEATLDLVGVHNQLSSILLQERGGLRGLEQAIDDATASAKKNGKTLDINTQAGRDNQEQLDRIADQYARLTPAQQQNEAITRRSRKAYIDTAVSMGMSRNAAKKLAEAIFAIPDKRKIDVRASVEQARRDIMRIQGFIDGMHGKTIKIAVEGGTPGGITTHADGGYIRGPGGPRDDAIPAMLSNGEFVINAAATSRNLSLLHQINSQRYAGGGFVQQAGGRAVASAAPDASGRAPSSYIEAIVDRIELRVEVGASNRTKADWYIDGKKHAGRLA